MNASEGFGEDSIGNVGQPNIGGGKNDFIV